MGTPDFAVPALQTLAAGHDIVAVYSQPPRPAGRGKKSRPSAVQQAAETLGIAVHAPVSLKADEEKTAFAAWNADVAVVAAYGLILSQAVLDAPRFGCLNIHASLLPRWRGAAPVQRAILAGDRETGVTIVQMERGLDTGPMLAKHATPTTGKTSGDLTEELTGIGAKLVCQVIATLPAGDAEPQNDEAACYAEKIGKDEARLAFSRFALDVERAIRAFNPMPGAFFLHNGERFKILAAEILTESGEPGTVLDEHLTIACGAGAIRPLLVQRAGKAAMPTANLLRGFPIAAGICLA